MSYSLDIPVNIFDSPDRSPTDSAPLSQDMLREVENQLMRKFMEKFGSNLNVADAVSLYANSVDGVNLIRSTRTNKDGSTNKNDKNFGNVYEGLEVHFANREGIVNGTGDKAARTDNLAMDKENGTLEHDSLASQANRYDQHTDVVHYDAQGNVLRTDQLKHVRGTAILLEEKYTTHPDAPTYIVVPGDMYDRHMAKLNKIAQRAHDPEVRKRAEVAMQKLRAGNVDSLWSGKADKDNYSSIAWMIDKTGGSNGAMGKAMPYVYIGTQVVSDAGIRAGGRTGSALLSEVGAFIVGGAIWELRDAYKGNSQITWMERVERLFWLIIGKLKHSAMLRGGRELAFETANMALGFLASTCNSIAALLKIVGNSLRKVWDSICDYVTGKISSFSELIAIISKTVAAIGIGTLAFLVEKKLSALGIPSIIGALLAAALGGVAIVFVNRGIDSIIFSITSAFSQAKAAELRREKIHTFCEEMIPRLISERENFEQMVNCYYAEREALMTKNFDAMRNALSTNNVAKLYSSLNDLNEMFGKSLGWSTQEEFEKMMSSDDPFVL